MSFSLTIEIDIEGRQFLLDNNEKIIIVFAGDKGAKRFIAFASFMPFGDSNNIDFFDDWIIYGTYNSIDFFDTVNTNESIKVNSGNVYQFVGYEFRYDSVAYSKNVFGLFNKISELNFACGFGQKVTFENNEIFAPINVCHLPKQQTIYFETTSIIRIFVASDISSNMILPSDILRPITSMTTFSKTRCSKSQTRIVGNYLEIDLKDTSTVTFDHSINAFKK